MRSGESRTHPAAFAALGLSAIIGLHALFILGWNGFFARVPWPGYEYSMRSGMVEPWFVNTPRSLWLTRIAFFAIAFGAILPIRNGRVARTLALWIGAAAGVAVLWRTTIMRTLEGGPAGYFFYPIRIGIPILAGALAAIVARRIFMPDRERVSR